MNNYSENSYVRTGSAVVKFDLGDVLKNVKKIAEIVNEAQEKNINILCLGELSLTGYTCGDLFFDTLILKNCLKGLRKLLDLTKNLDVIYMVGMPMIWHNNLYNVAVVIKKDKILGIVPKSYIPNAKEFYERRWFSSGINITNEVINLFDQMIPFGTDLIFEDYKNPNASFAVEICEDLWVPCPPSIRYAQCGATMIFNLSASNDIVGKNEYRKKLISMQSARLNAAYIYSSSGINESTSDLVFGGAAFIYENGKMLQANKRFELKGNLIYSDIDIENLVHDRIQNTNFTNEINNNLRRIKVELPLLKGKTCREYSKYPFVPNGTILENKDRYEEIVTIQAIGLSERLNKIGMPKMIIGLSGGLDSTHAFLVMIKACDMLNITYDNIIAVTMPCFGTTSGTHNNAIKLANAYGATFRDESIIDVCKEEMKLVGISEDDKTVTFENIQARARTELLMNIANKENAIVIGTGDLSELALGWCTYNGDHMSMYAVNNSIPKTLMQHLVRYFIETEQDKTRKDVLTDILMTKISPELLPAKDDQIQQNTEDIIGPYALHDFFLYYFIRYRKTPSQLYELAKNAFKDEFSLEKIQETLKIFITRFFTQQFKRDCVPDGPKVGTINLSPRGDWRMPSDIQKKMWIDNLENAIKNEKNN